MAIYPVVNNRYLNQGIMGLVNKLTLDQLASRDSNGAIITRGNGTLAVQHTIYAVPDAHTADLPATGSASTNITPTADVITVTMGEKGEGVITVPASATLSGAEFDDALAVNIQRQAVNAGKSLNALASTALKGVIPASGAFTHGTMSFADVQASSLVYLGTGTSSKSARSNVLSTDVITSSWIDRAYIDLVNRGVKPFVIYNGKPVYACAVHPNVWFDIEQDTSNNGFIDTIKYTSSADDAILLNNVGIWKGFVWFLDSSLVYTGAGDSGINVYPTVFLGQDYVVKDFASLEMLPVAGTGVEVLNLLESAQLRLVPSYGTHGREKYISWYAYVGYNILNPNSGFRLEVASSLG